MGINIFPIRLWVDHCYIIQDKGVTMIDCGSPKKAKVFKKAIERIHIKPDEIQLSVITHGHMDHIRSANDIKGLT